MRRRLFSRFSRLAAVATALLMIPVTAGAAVVIDETNFPDPNFRAWLLEQDYGQDGVLTDEEIGEVTEINIFRAGIKSMEGIKTFKELEGLSLTLNDLSELDVSGLTKLGALMVQENHLTKLDLTGCKELEGLSCNGNQLSELNLSGYTRLRYLNCNDNRLTRLDISDCTNLHHVYCNKNQLSELILPPAKEMVWLMCGDNRLTKIDISGLPRLDWLYCYGNQIGSEAMGDIIENLPVEYSNAFFYVIRGDIPDGNVCTRDQVAAARAKGWIPRTYSNGGGSEEYEGTDPVSVAEIKVEKADDPWYDLSGRKLQKAPKKGLFIQDGKKVLVK